MRLSSALLTLAACGILVGCSQAALSSSPLPIEARLLPNAGHTVIYAFKNSPDGANPYAGLVAVNGVFYGTTKGGGAHSCGLAGGCGTVYEVSKTNPERIVYSFKGAPDGAFPRSDLIYVKGTLYGTTATGGSACGFGCGTVFSLTPSGVERVLYSFKGDTDGAAPEAGVIFVDGKLYGTTRDGGPNNQGTVFEISLPGTAERVLYSFEGRLKGGSDGATPLAGLTQVDGKLYGTTVFGGTSTNGTVFEITPSTGSERILHSFGGGYGDGAQPSSPLIALNGKLYGTTENGGATASGTVFEVDVATGAERVIYDRFGFRAKPLAGLTVLNRKFYGTTQGTGPSGSGIVFEVAPSGEEHTVFAFKGEKGGANPVAGMIEKDGALFGTTLNGGANGHGTVFELIP